MLMTHAWSSKPKPSTLYLNTEFNKLCDWFVDNKLSIHFGDDKTKSILFSGKNRRRDDNLKISRGSIEVAQHKEINYLGCLFDEKCTVESMALNVIDKINGSPVA